MAFEQRMRNYKVRRVRRVEYQQFVSLQCIRIPEQVWNTNDLAAGWH